MTTPLAGITVLDGSDSPAPALRRLSFDGSASAVLPVPLAPGLYEHLSVSADRKTAFWARRRSASIDLMLASLGPEGDLPENSLGRPWRRFGHFC